MYIISRVDGLGTKLHSTVPGNAWTKLVATPSRRSKVRITNNSDTYNLLLTYVQRGAAAPVTTIASQYEDLIAPGTTLTISFGEGIDVYGANSSGGGTTSAFTSREMQ